MNLPKINDYVKLRPPCGTGVFLVLAQDRAFVVRNVDAPADPSWSFLVETFQIERTLPRPPGFNNRDYVQFLHEYEEGIIYGRIGDTFYDEEDQEYSYKIWDIDFGRSWRISEPHIVPSCKPRLHLAK